MSATYCPSCGVVITGNNRRMGAIITCLTCDTELEVISLDPFEVDFPIDYYDDEEYEHEEKEKSEEEWRRR